MEALIKIKAIAQNPYAYASTLKKTSGKSVVGNFCSYTPEEFIVAAGAVPFRLFGTRGDISLADAHLQSYCCSLVGGAGGRAPRESEFFRRHGFSPHL